MMMHLQRERGKIQLLTPCPTVTPATLLELQSPDHTTRRDTHHTPITRRRGRTRSPRPIRVPPSFPSSQLLPVMSIPETLCIIPKRSKHRDGLFFLLDDDDDSNTNRSTTKHRQSRHPLRLPTFWRGHVHIRTTGRKTRGRRFCRWPWR
jgi:hypothetical protein